MLIEDSIVEYSDKYLEFDYDVKKIGISLKLNKDYVPGDNSSRMFLGGSMEPGIKGLESKVAHFDVVLKKEDGGIVKLNNSLRANDFSSLDSLKLDQNINIIYENEFTLSQMIYDMNNNVNYTRGVNFDNSEIYFWFDDSLVSVESDEAKQFVKSLYFIVEKDKFKTGKYIIEKSKG